MKQRLSTKSKLRVIIFIWAVTIIMTVPYALTRRYEKIGGECFCIEESNAMTQKVMAIYLVILVVIIWIIPMLVTGLLYGLCVRELRESSLNNDNSDSMKRRILENQKVVRMFILIEALFCICTLPHSILYAILGLHTVYKIDLGASYPVNISILRLCLYSLSLANSCMNPFIYTKRQPEMKAFVKKVWNKLCCKALRSNTQTASMERDS